LNFWEKIVPGQRDTFAPVMPRVPGHFPAAHSESAPMTNRALCMHWFTLCVRTTCIVTT